MKIRDILVFGLRGGTPPGGWTNELRPEDCVHTLLAIVTEDGLVGWGSASTSDHLVRAALHTLAPVYLGAASLDPDRLSSLADRTSFWIGHGGAITHAISALDIALWDLHGQVTGQSIGRLLSGRHREQVQLYASVLMEEPDGMAATIEPLRTAGFEAFKIGWGPFGRVSDRMDEAIVAAARSGAGANARLMVDAGASDGHWLQGLAWARRTGSMLAEHGVEWFEEPLPPDLIDDFVRLRSSIGVAVASGEVLVRRAAFQPWIDRGAVDILQPDVTKVGGLSEMRRIGWAAGDHGIKLIPHGWNTAIGLAADLQLAASLATTDLVEYRPGSPYIDDLAEWALVPGGHLAIPDKPGLGVSPDLDALRRYSDASLVNRLPRPDA